MVHLMLDGGSGDMVHILEDGGGRDMVTLLLDDGRGDMVPLSVGWCGVWTHGPPSIIWWGRETWFSS